VALSTLVHGIGDEAASDLGNRDCLQPQMICLVMSAPLAFPQINMLVFSIGWVKAPGPEHLLWLVRSPLVRQVMKTWLRSFPRPRMSGSLLDR
jgi:hypothetical protein